MATNERKIKLPFVKGGEEITLPDLTDTTMREHLDLLTLRYAAEQHLNQLGLKQPSEDDPTLGEYKNLRAWEMNYRTVVYVLKKIDPDVKEKAIDQRARKDGDWLGEMILKMYPKKKDFQEAEKTAKKKRIKEQAKN